MKVELNKADIDSFISAANTYTNTALTYDIESYDFNKEMHLIDERYQVEKKLLQAISLGNKADAINALYEYGQLMQSPLQKNYPTSPNPLRDFKNSVHTMNTLFRKAVESNQVHPIYIHDYSSRFGYQIEASTTEAELELLIADMIKKYCYLSKNYSLANYSKTVKNAILYINMNLGAPISTKDVATHLNVSANFLSNQFKAEMEITITDYIRSKRMDMAIKLLNSTELPIQEIAGQIGIDDASYFSKLFKQTIGMSPLKYKQMIRKR